MDKHEFLKKIDSLKEATELLLDHSETEMRNLKSENTRLSEKLEAPQVAYQVEEYENKILNYEYNDIT